MSPRKLRPRPEKTIECPAAKRQRSTSLDERKAPKPRPPNPAARAMNGIEHFNSFSRR